MPIIPFNNNISDIKAFGQDVAKVMAYGEKVYESSIPNTYTPCDYIQNTTASNGAVDLGFKFRLLEYSIETKFKQDSISNGMVCGTKSNNAGALWFYNYISSDRFYIDAAYSSGWKMSKSMYQPLDTSIHTLGYIGSSSACSVTKDGAVYGTSQDLSPYANEQSTENLFIFGRGDTTNPYKGRIYYLKVWNTATEEVICNLIPCSRNSDGAAGFWDTAQKQFFTSAYWTAHFDNE